MLPEGFSAIVHTETMIALDQRHRRALTYILEPGNKRDVARCSKKILRLSKEEDVEASYSRLAHCKCRTSMSRRTSKHGAPSAAGRQSEPQSARSRLGASDRHRPGAQFGSQRIHGRDEKETTTLTNLTCSPRRHEEHEASYKWCAESHPTKTSCPSRLRGVIGQRLRPTKGECPCTADKQY